MLSDWLAPDPSAGRRWEHARARVLPNAHSILTAVRDEREIRQAFVAKFPDLFPVEYNASLQQALFLSNNPPVDDLLKPRPGNTTAKLLALPKPTKRAKQAFMAVFGRKPDAEELERAVTFLVGQASRLPLEFGRFGTSPAPR